ncbi:hypothetical protein CTAM01_08407 [Colletotrichum tamarilloi]|uniref:Uncharacterized protein n=1 Tax=Colletotrichum tamarilloi TaxID=1209934 RepID=A0ABQ9R683_9PEZI|nr:uncharacterized protein CTAM01_08407 [Colletotrichum tamarilloi]KAI3540253.1 hypothetical protein CSPX01_08442 [Colletotrichum filicis]KAK1496220.1 hypothetical protein CTAM01_08407 [Colletotrichum tamarilloi]
MVESTIRAETTDRMHAAAYEWLEASSEVTRFIIIVQGFQVKIILPLVKVRPDPEPRPGQSRLPEKLGTAG